MVTEEMIRAAERRALALPPWTDQVLTPRLAIAYLTFDPVTCANMGEYMADHVIATLKSCGFEIVPTTAKLNIGLDSFGPSHASRLTK